MAENDDTEVRDRVRRIETKLNVLADALRIEVGGAKPLWDATSECVRLPTPNCSLAKIVSAIPADTMGNRVDLFVADEFVATITLLHASPTFNRGSPAAMRAREVRQ
jgi:hypothetical protein